MNSTTIRQATPRDLPRIKAIIDVSFPRFFRYFALHSVSDFSEPTLLCQQDEIICGFVKLIEFDVGAVKYGCILWIAVHPDCRGRGVGFALTCAGIDWLKSRGAGAIFASTRRGNSAALATLAKAGFGRLGFVGLWRLFGWRVFEFYRDIWFAPGEIVLALL